MAKRNTCVLLIFLCVLFGTKVWSQSDVCSLDYPGGALCSCVVAGTSSNYDCRNKNIYNVPTAFLETATQINLSNNKLTVLVKGSFNKLRNIEKLFLQSNSISFIEEGTFDGLMKLNILDLSNNKLQSINDGMFRHLAGLATINLKYNLIKDIGRHTFFTCPSLTSLSMDSNQLVCGCEERLFRQYLDLRKGILTVTNTVCTNIDNGAIDNIELSQFPTCPPDETLIALPKNNECYVCADAAGIKDCATKQVRSCVNPSAVCYTQISYQSGHVGVWGGCKAYSSCLESEKANVQNCKAGATVATCFFCNPGGLSNGHDVIDTTQEFDVLALVTLNKDMTSDLKDVTTSAYNFFTKNLAIEVKNSLHNKDGAYLVQFLDLRSPRVTIALRIHCTTMWFTKKKDTFDILISTLKTRSYSGVRTTSVEVTLLANENKVTCAADTTTDATYGTFVWKETPTEQVATVTCPYQLTGTSNNLKTASRTCKKNSTGKGQWETPLVKDCPQADTVSRSLQSLAETDINQQNVVAVSTDVSDLSGKWEQFESEDVAWTSTVVDSIIATDTNTAKVDVATNTIKTINNVMFIQQDILTESNTQSKSSSRLVSAVDDLLERVDVTSGRYAVAQENIAAMAAPVTGTDFLGLSMSYESTFLKDGEVIYTEREDGIAGGRSGIVLPRSIFETLSNRKRRDVRRVTTHVLRDSKLQSSITPTYEKRQIVGDNNVTIEVVRTINSNVIGANVPGVNVKNLKAPVSITFQHMQAGDNAACVFWDESSETWLTDGCSVNATNTEFTRCHCNHLTNFALLMDVYGTGGSLSQADILALSIISYIGCGVSLFAVCLTILTYLMFKKLRRDNPSKILMNLCLSIGLVDFVFVVGMQGYTSNSTAGCKIVAVLLHYFLLCAMFWMAVESFYMYLALVKVFNTYITRFQLKSALFGWGLPLVIVGVTLGVNGTDNYGIQPGGICWLDQIPFYGAFLGPVCLIIIVNSVMYVLVLKQIIRRSSKKLSKTDKSNTAVRVRGAVSLLILLGLTWIFAIFAVGDFGIVFHYLFAIFNSLQGLFIFIFHCLLKKEAQQNWKSSLLCFKSPYREASSATNSKSFSNTLDSNKTVKTTSTDLQSKKVTDKVKNGDFDGLNTENKNVTSKEPTAFRGTWQLKA